MVVSVRSNWVLPLVLIGVTSCSSSLEPRSGVTLLVTNTACRFAPCPSQHILGFPGNQPHTPGGFWSLDLGTISTPTACLTLPASAHIYIINSTANDTTTITWTTALGLSLGTLQPQESRLMASPSTGEFVPASAPGWSVAFPGGTQVAPHRVC